MHVGCYFKERWESRKAKGPGHPEGYPSQGKTECSPALRGFQTTLISHVTDQTLPKSELCQMYVILKLATPKDGERKTFVEQADHFYEDDEWLLVAQRFNIPLKDQPLGDRTPQTFKTLCIGSGYTDVSYIETP